MENIGLKLKAIRESLNLTRKEVADKLKDYGIDMSDKTLYGYEVGRTSANADTFLALCDIYQIHDILDTFGRKVNTKDVNITLSNKEIILIESLRQLDDFALETIDNIVELENKRKSEQIKRLNQYASKIKEEKP